MIKKISCFLLILLMAFMAACSKPTALKEETPAQASEVVVFTDPVLEAKVREIMGKPEGDITVAEAEAVEELDLSNEWQPQIPEDVQVTDISSLAYFTNLTRLSLTFNRVTDIGALTGLTKLQDLDLGGNQVSDISTLSGLTYLAGLTLFGNCITDISALSGLINMQSLFIHGNQITEITPIANMKQLKMLMMDGNLVSDISPLAGLPIDKLFLNGNPIEDFSPIEDIYPNLVDKDFEILSAGNIPDEPIVFENEAFEKALRTAMNRPAGSITKRDAFMVQSLELYNEKTEETIMTDISPLVYFVNLKSLSFNANRISDLSPLAGLTKLTSLNVSFNQVADLSPLAGLTQLESLKLNNNMITDITPLSGMNNLWDLMLAENPIEDLSPLADIYLNLSNKDFDLD